MLLLALLIVWLSALLIVLQFAPQIIAAVKALIDAIREKNAAKGSAAASEAFTLATQIVVSFATRTDLPNGRKREQAVSDLLAAAPMVGLQLSESDVRTLIELAYKQVKAK